jgi:NTP pyrophosphatase (non-canonical NTP hydrolase)
MVSFPWQQTRWKGVWREQRGRASMGASLLSAVGECVEAVRSAIPRLCA